MKYLITLLLLIISPLFGAKVSAPLFSFGARGKIGGALVYFPWKGIDCVRSYVIPANPQTDAQVTQRGYMTSAVAEWHGTEYTSADVQAWNTYAGVLAAIMSGFNAMVKKFIEEIILGNVWERLDNAVTSNVFADMFRVTIDKAAAGNSPTLRWGTRKTHFPNSVAMTDNADGTWFGDCTPLLASTLYYFYIDVGASGVDYARTGIYSQRTTA